MSEIHYVEEDIAFLKNLQFNCLKINEKDGPMIKKVLALQSLFCSRLDFEDEKVKLDVAKEECGRLQKLIDERSVELNNGEDQLQALHDKKELLKSDLKDVADKVTVKVQEFNKLKKLQRPGSNDRSKVHSQVKLLKIYENLFKMKLRDSSLMTNKPKNFVYGFIYNDVTQYVRNFNLPLVRGIAWDLLTPAAHLSWVIDCSDDENHLENSMSTVPFNCERK